MTYTRQPTTFTSGTVVTSAWANWLNQKSQEVVSVLDYGATGDGVTNDTAAIQAALNSGAGLIYFPPGTYKILSPLLPKTQQYLLGAQRTKCAIVAGTGFAGTAMISYPSGTYSGITIQSLTINANNIAARGLEMIGSSQGYVDQIKLRDLSVALATSRPIHFENVTYWAWDSVLTSGGADGTYIYNCYSGETRDCVSYHGTRAALIIVNGASITLNAHKLFNNAGTNSACLLEIDGSHDVVANRCEFEPQGAANVTSEVWIHDSSGSGNCSDNKFIDCGWVGLSATKTRCLTIGGTTVVAGTSGINVYKTSVIRGRFIKPAAESVLLKDQTDTNFVGSVDLITYDTGARASVTILNSSPNPYQLEGELTGTFTVSVRGTTTDPTITSGTITGTWTKQGRQVTFFVITGAITWSAAGTGDFRLRFSGLDLSNGINTPVTLGVCTLFTNAVSAAVVSATDIGLFPIGSNTTLNWTAPPTSGGQVSLAGTITLAS